MKSMAARCCIFVQLLSLLLQSCDAAPFLINGPTITLTLKDPAQQANNPPVNIIELLEQQSSGVIPDTPQSPVLPWLDFASLRPNIVWEMTSLAPPLPYWLPRLKQLKGRIGCQYKADTTSPVSTVPSSSNTAPLSSSSSTTTSSASTSSASTFSWVRKLPVWVEGTAKFASVFGELIVQPKYEIPSQETTIFVEASRGAHWALAKLGFATRAQIVPTLDAVRASFAFNLPLMSLSQARFTPSWEAGRDWALQCEAVTGGYGRTRAVLNLEWTSPTLSVIHQLDSRNTIAPTINLNNARIVYSWTCLLGRLGSSSVRTTVDPTSSIDITWTDTSEGVSGSWVTDIRLPLEATTLQKLAADVRIRRQFRF